MRSAFIISLLAISANTIAQIPQALELEKIIAWVDDEIILKSEFEITKQQFANRLAISGAGDVSCQVLETLIINKMLVAKSKIDSVYVEDDQVELELNRRVQQIFSVYGGDQETVLKEYGKTLEQLKDEIRPTLKEQLLTQKMQGKITDGVSITPREIKKFYNQIPQDSLPNFSTEVSVAQIVRYAKPNLNAKRETRARLEAIRQRIINGESFSKLAGQYSQDPGSAARGGELGMFGRGQLVPEFEAAALRLKPGGVSEVVESQFGFHVIQLIEKRGTEFNSRHILLKVETSYLDLETEKSFLDSIARLIRKDSLEFTEAAFKYNEDDMTKATNGFLTDNQGNYRIPVDQLDAKTYFAVDRLENGQISDPIEYTNPASSEEGVRLLLLKEKTPPHRANLKDDYQKIKDAALDERRNKEIDKWFQEAKQEIYLKVDSDYNKCKILQD